MKIIRIVAYWLFVVCVPVLLFTSTVRLGVNSMYTYEYGFDKYSVSDATNIDRAQLSEVARRLVDYFNSKEETPQIEGLELFQERELVHLKDVRELFQLDYRIQMLSLACIVVYALLFLLWRKERWQDLAKGIRWGCALTLVFIIMLSIASVFSFDQVFIRFHYLVFGDPSHSPWIFDPSRDYLIRLFPPPFWQDIAMFGAMAISAETLLLGGVAWGVPFIYQRRTC